MTRIQKSPKRGKWRTRHNLPPNMDRVLREISSLPYVSKITLGPFRRTKTAAPSPWVSVIKVPDQEEQGVLKVRIYCGRFIQVAYIAGNRLQEISNELAEQLPRVKSNRTHRWRRRGEVPARHPKVPANANPIAKTIAESTPEMPHADPLPLYQVAKITLDGEPFVYTPPEEEEEVEGEP